MTSVGDFHWSDLRRALESLLISANQHLNPPKVSAPACVVGGDRSDRIKVWIQSTVRLFLLDMLLLYSRIGDVAGKLRRAHIRLSFLSAPANSLLQQPE